MKILNKIKKQENRYGYYILTLEQYVVSKWENYIDNIVKISPASKNDTQQYLILK